MVRWIKAVLKPSLSSKLLANAVLGLGLETKISVYILSDLWVGFRYLKQKTSASAFLSVKLGLGRQHSLVSLAVYRNVCWLWSAALVCFACHTSLFLFLIIILLWILFFFFLSPDVNPSLEKCFLRLLSFNFIHVIERCSIFFPESLFLLCCCLVVCFT